MSDFPWDLRASLWVGTKLYTTGSLAELAFLYDRDVRDDVKWTAYLAGSDLPVLAEGDAPHVMRHEGLELLRAAYAAEKPRG